MDTTPEPTPAEVRRPTPSAGRLTLGLALVVAGVAVLVLGQETPFAALGGVAALVGVALLLTGIHAALRSLDALAAAKYNEAISSPRL